MFRRVLSLACLLTCVTTAHAAEPDWAAILVPAQVKVPAPQDKVIWRPDLAAALLEAQSTGRPLFVTLRCLPCKQCSAFDKDVLEGGPDLDPLLKQFVTVRLIDAGAVDLRLFPMPGFQDMDLSWWGYFLSPQGQIYGIFGGRDEVSDATRISKAGLVNTLGRVLKYHYDPRRKDWRLDGPAPVLLGDAATAKQLPGYASWFKHAGPETQKQTCVHCHQVSEILRQPSVDLMTFDKNRDLDIWPLPENVGIVVDRDLGLTVSEVKPDSPAARAGIRAGDVLAEAGGRLLFSQADFRGVLHRGPKGAGEISVHWLRMNTPMAGRLAVAEGWRKTVLDWRASVAGGNVGQGPGFFPIAVKPDRRKQYGIPEGTMAVEPFVGPKGGPAHEAGVKKGDLIVGVDGEHPDLAARTFLVWFRFHHQPGDEVTLRVRDSAGGERDVKYRLRGAE